MPQNTANRDILAGLDVGSSKVSVVVAERQPNGRLEVIGRAAHPSQGLKQGVVVNIEKTVHAIKEAISQVELMAGCKVEEVLVGIAGSHISSQDTAGMVAISNKEVSAADVQRVLDSASTIALNADQHVLHVLPQEYMIDNQVGVLEPIGMSGVRLESKVHMVTCSVSAFQNLSKCVELCKLKIKQIILEPLASSHSVLTDDERELGVCVIDIGAGTTDIVIFTDGAIRHISTLPVAGQNVTKDIAMLLRTPNHDAERIKLQHACAYTELAPADEIIEVPSVGGRAPREVSLSALAPAIEARYQRVLEQIKHVLTSAGYYEDMRAGIVLTGGASKVFGLVELAEEILEMPARIGEPHGIDSVISEVYDPVYSTALGLLQHEQSGHPTSSQSKAKPILQPKQNPLSGIKNWINKNF